MRKRGLIPTMRVLIAPMKVGYMETMHMGSGPSRYTPIVLALVLWLAARAVQAAPFDHSAWDGIVKQYVDANGRVAYRSLEQHDGDTLKRYLAALGAAKPDGMSEKEQLAFWINAYNAMIVEGILEGYSAESVFKRYSFFKRYEQVIAGKRRAPDEIEHAIIRKRFHDPRTHFAVVCASSSCPKLRREAYVGARLDAQLDDQARQFLSDPTRNRIDPATGAVELSQIFNWFTDDFTQSGKRTLADFLAPYLMPAQAQLLRDKPPTYLEYNWAMNAQPGQRPDGQWPE